MNRKLPDWLERLEARSDGVVLATSALLVGIAAVADYAVGWRIDLLALYIVPIVAAAWAVGLTSGIGMAIFAAGAAVAASQLAGNPIDSRFVPALAFLSNLVVFSSFAALAFGMRRTRFSRQQLRFTDALTGLPTSDVFYRDAGHQVKTAVRYGRPVSLAYIGVDNFGALNERFGHKTGDEVLVSISHAIRENLRDTDLVARLGGDEFGVLFPETAADAGRTVAAKLRDRLVQATDGWPISFSVGLVTCDRTACSLHDLIQRSERLMKDVKREGRNDVRAELFAASTSPEAESSATSHSG